MLNRGKTQVVLFDASTKKYSAMRGASVDATDKLIEKLGEMFSPENVVLK